MQKELGNTLTYFKKQIHSASWDVEISTPNLATLTFPNSMQNYPKMCLVMLANVCIKRLNHAIKSKEMANDSKLTVHNL